MHIYGQTAGWVIFCVLILWKAVTAEILLYLGRTYWDSKKFKNIKKNNKEKKNNMWSKNNEMWGQKKKKKKSTSFILLIALLTPNFWMALFNETHTISFLHRFNKGKLHTLMWMISMMPSKEYSKAVKKSSGKWLHSVCSTFETRHLHLNTKKQCFAIRCEDDLPPAECNWLYSLWFIFKHWTHRSIGLA